jgi:hypothetical protein
MVESKTPTSPPKVEENILHKAWNKVQNLWQGITTPKPAAAAGQQPAAGSQQNLLEWLMTEVSSKAYDMIPEKGLVSKHTLTMLQKPNATAEKEIAALSPEEKQAFDAFKKDMAKDLAKKPEILALAAVPNVGAPVKKLLDDPVAGMDALPGLKAAAFQMYQETKDLKDIQKMADGGGFDLSNIVKAAPLMFKMFASNPKGFMCVLFKSVQAGMSVLFDGNFKGDFGERMQKVLSAAKETFDKDIKTAIAPGIKSVMEERAANIEKRVAALGFDPEVGKTLREGVLDGTKEKLKEGGIDVTFDKPAAPAKPAPQPPSAPPVVTVQNNDNNIIANLMKQLNVSGNIAGGANTTVASAPAPTPAGKNTQSTQLQGAS